MIRTTLAGIGARDASVQAIASRSMPGHGVLAEEPLEVGSKVSVRFSRIRSQGACRGYQPVRVVHFWCRKLVHSQLSLDSKVSDKRYGFLFQAPQSEHEYDAMAATMKRLMDYSDAKAQIKVIDFSEVPSDILPVIVGLVARIIYQVQFWTDRDKRKPMALVCDEAHLYLPKKEGKNPIEQRAIENFEKIAKEGRKYGVALLIVSQRPSDVSPTILSQCNNVVVLRLTNGDDQATVRKLMPESLEGLMDTLPILDIGEALVVGDAVLLPSRIRIHPPKEKPLGMTIDFWDEWAKQPITPNFGKAVENMRRQNRT